MTLKKRLGSSTAWMSLAASGNSLVSFLIFIVLSRILAPEDIGLVAFALIVVEIGKIVVTAGFAQAVVQHSVWDDVYASTCFYANIAFATLVSLLIIFVGAPLIAHYYEPKAGPVLTVLSAMYFMEGLKAVHEGKLKRNFNFRAIAFRTVAAGLASGVVGVYLALHGYGVWALVWQQLVNQFTTSLLTIIYGKWAPLLVFSREQFKTIIRFSFPLMSAQLISSVSNNIMELLIGVILGPAALGFYRVGGRALYILQDILLKPFEHTALSALSRINTLASQAEGTIRMIRMSSCITFPIFFGAAAIAPEFVVLAFGEKWSVSGHIMTILAIGVAPLIVGYNINAALTASNNSRLVMTQASIAFAINCVLGAIVVPFGIIAAAFGFAIRNYLITFINFYFFRKIFNTSIIQMLKVIAPTLLASIIMFIVVTQAKVVLAEKLPLAIEIIALCAIGGTTYAILMATVFRTETKNFFRESIDLAPVKLKPMIIALQGLIKLT